MGTFRPCISFLRFALPLKRWLSTSAPALLVVLFVVLGLEVFRLKEHKASLEELVKQKDSQFRALEKLHEDSQTAAQLDAEQTARSLHAFTQDKARLGSKGEELNGYLQTCEGERQLLLSELNGSRMRAHEIHDLAHKAMQCCDSVPMCNLCRMRR